MEIDGGEAYDPNEFDGTVGYTHGDTITQVDSDYFVSDADQPEDAIDADGAGDGIWIKGGAEIYMTGVSGTLEPGVTIASDHGQDRADGALLYQVENEFNAFISTEGNDVRITEIRFSGPEHEHWALEDKNVDSIYDVGITRALTMDGDEVEIDNCRFSGFSYTGIRVGM